MSDLANLHQEAQSMRMRAWKDGHSSIPLREFDEYIFVPLLALLKREHKRQLAEIRERGT